MDNIKIIYDNDNCPFLKMTEIWFKNKNIFYKKVKTKDIPDNIKNYINGDGKYPKILINNHIINGYSDLIKKESYILYLLGIFEPEN